MDYIYFELNNRKLKINRENSEDIWIWKENKTKNSYWTRPTLSVNNNGYFYLHIGNNKLLHRVVFYAHNQEWDIHDSSQLNFIDHKDQNRQNNNLNNLRIATKQQNNWNRKTKGCFWNKNRNKWQAQICVNNKSKYLGQFDSEEDARLAYLTAKPIYHPDW